MSKRRKGANKMMSEEIKKQQNLETAEKQQNATPAPKDETPDEPENKIGFFKRNKKRIGIFAGIGAGVAAIGGAIAFILGRKDDPEPVDDLEDVEDYPDRHEDVEISEGSVAKIADAIFSKIDALLNPTNDEE